MVDQLPSWARYLLATVIVPTVAFIVTAVTGAVIADGAAFVNWETFLPVVLNDASKVLAGGIAAYAAYYFLPLTKKFGLQSHKEV